MPASSRLRCRWSSFGQLVAGAWARSVDGLLGSPGSGGFGAILDLTSGQASVHGLGHRSPWSPCERSWLRALQACSLASVPASDQSSRSLEGTRARSGSALLWVRVLYTVWRLSIDVVHLDLSGCGLSLSAVPLADGPHVCGLAI
jgi:hypothetical protein